MAMSNAELEVALKSALQRLVTALANKVAPDSLLLEGKSLAEITSLILAGKAATAGTADNACFVRNSPARQIREVIVIILARETSPLKKTLAGCSAIELAPVSSMGSSEST